MMIEGVLIGLLVFTPLAFGTVHTWAISLTQAGVLVLFSLWLIRLIWARPESRPTRSAPVDGAAVKIFGYRLVRTRLAAPVALFLVLVALQLVPLPPAIVRAISPASASTFDRSLPGYASGGPVDFRRFETWLAGTDEGAVEKLLSGPGAIPIRSDPIHPAARPLSVYPFETARRFLMLLTLLMTFLVAANAIRDRAALERVWWIVIITGLGMSVLGMVQRLQWNGRIYWFYPVAEGASPYGPFLNHNHFAAYLEMAIPLAVAMLLARLSRLRGAPPPAAAEGGTTGPGGLLVVMRRGPEALARLGMSGFTAIVMLAALVLSGSRGAIMSLAAATLLYGAVMLLRGQTGRSEWIVAGVILVAGISFSAWVGAERVAETGRRLASVSEFEAEPSLSARVLGWRYTLHIFRDYPLLGSGLGTFAQAWLHYYPPGTANIWKEAHNDYLQVGAETGLAGLTAFIWGLIVFLRRYLFRDTREPAALSMGDPQLRHGIAIGLLSLLFHSMVDFSLQVAAIALLFVVLAGILVGETARSAEALT